MKLKDIKGQQFGNWLVLERAENLYGNKQASWLCECQCAAKTKKVLGSASLRSGSTKSCKICKRSYQKLRPYEALFRRLQRDNERDRKLEFSLTYEDFVSFSYQLNCHYCNASISWKAHNSSGYGYNLDRKDNDKGYTKENCIVCCKRCNFGKRDTFTYEEWYGMTEYFR